MVDFEWYRSFVAIYQTGTVSGAAQRRNMTQPTISQHLQVLEQALNTQLFDRTPRRMIPTASGSRLYQEILGAVERLESAANRQPQAQPMRIAMTIDTFDEFVIKVVAEAGDMPYPLQFVFRKDTELLALLENDEADMAIMADRLNQEQVYYAPVAGVPMAVIAPPDTAIPPDMDASEMRDWLAGQQWLSSTTSMECVRQYWINVFNQPPDFHVTLALGDFHAVAQGVVHGLGFGVAPLNIVQSHLQAGRLLIPYDPPTPPIYNIYLACLHTRRSSPAFDWFLNLLIGALHGITPEAENSLLPG